MKELAKLIVTCVERFDGVVGSAACGCNIPLEYDIADTQKIFDEISREFKLTATFTTESGKCTMAPLEKLVVAWGVANLTTCRALFINDTILVTTTKENIKELIKNLRSMTSYVVADGHGYRPE